MKKNEFPEIDNRTMKLIVGIIALSLPAVTNYLAGFNGGHSLDSISESYWRGGWPQSVFVGSLFAIASFLVAYNGLLRSEMVLSKVAAAAAVGVALFPCDCQHVSRPGCDVSYGFPTGLHYLAAIMMFGVLTYFCFIFLRRARSKGGLKKGSRALGTQNPQATLRGLIYIVCAVGIVVCTLAMAYNGATGGGITAHFSTFVFWAEAGGLWCFGISWLTSSHVLPVVNSEAERFKPLTSRTEQPPISAPKV
jgi:hypothetical protein